MQTKAHPLMSPTVGTARQITSFHYGQNAGQKIYIQSSVHANELPGMLTTWALRHKLAALEAACRIRGEIVVVPVANPIGMNQHMYAHHHGNFESHSCENFNRNFYDLAALVLPHIEARLSDDSDMNRIAIRATMRQLLDAQKPKTELDSQRLVLQRLSCDADVVLDLHCDWEAPVYLVANQNVWEDVEPLARYLDAEVSILYLDTNGGMFSEVHNFCWPALRERFGERFPIPNGSIAVTVELRGALDVTYEFAEKDAQSIIEYLTFRGVIEGQAAPLPPLTHTPTPKADTEAVVTPCSGVLVFRVEPGALVQAGTPIADVVDPLTDNVTTLKCTTGGKIFSRRNVRFATAGMAVASVAGSSPRSQP